MAKETSHPAVCTKRTSVDKTDDDDKKTKPIFVINDASLPTECRVAPVGDNTKDEPYDKPADDKHHPLSKTVDGGNDDDDDTRKPEDVKKAEKEKKPDCEKKSDCDKKDKPVGDKVKSSVEAKSCPLSKSGDGGNDDEDKDDNSECEKKKAECEKKKTECEKKSECDKEKTPAETLHCSFSRADCPLSKSGDSCNDDEEVKPEEDESSCDKKAEGEKKDKPECEKKDKPRRDTEKPKSKHCEDPEKRKDCV